MFGSQSLDMAIGLVFTFLTVSLICTAVNEMIATWTHSRAKMLERAIRSFLADNSDLFAKDKAAPSSLPKWALTAGRAVRRALPALFPAETPPDPTKDLWASDFLNHPLVNSTAQNDAHPSYVPGDTFANVLVDLVVRKSQVPDAADKLAAASRSASPADFAKLRQLVAGVDNEHLRKLLIPLLDKVKAQPAVASAVKAFTDEIESWYDDAMDRVSGWYKRKTQNVLLVIAVVVAFVGNIDAIAVWQSLGDVKTRASVITAAEVAMKSVPTPDDKKDLRAAYNDLQTQISNAGRLGIPIGWHWNSTFNHEPRPDNLYDALHTSLFATKLIGLLLTAIAASLGAPFWFDILKYIMSVRAAGKAPEEAPIPPKEVPKPEEPEKAKPVAVASGQSATASTGLRDLLAQAAALNPSTAPPAFPERRIILRK